MGVGALHGRMGRLVWLSWDHGQVTNLQGPVTLSDKTASEDCGEEVYHHYAGFYDWQLIMIANCTELSAL